MESQALAQTIAGLVLLFFMVAGSIVLLRGWQAYRRHGLMLPALDRRLLRRPWRGRDILWILLFFAASQVAIRYLLPLTGAAGSDGEFPLYVMLLAGGGTQLAVLAAIRFLMFRHRCGWRKAFGPAETRPVPALRLAVLFYLGMWPVQIAVIPAYHALLHRLGFAVDWQETMVMLTMPGSPAVLAVLLVMALVLAPVTEELLFRGILLPVMRRRMGIWPALLFSSLLFAMFHDHLPSLAGLFIVSMACSLATLASGSVATAIWLHALFNTVSTLMAWSLKDIIV